MAWIAVELEGTLVNTIDDGIGNVTVMPVDGSIEAMNQLSMEGHRLTVFTSKFAPMPSDRRQQLKEQIEQELVAYGFPIMEVWTGTTKPAADIFIGDNNVTFDGDWGLALAQTQVMMEERGLVPGPMPYDDFAADPESMPVEDEGVEQ